MKTLILLVFCVLLSGHALAQTPTTGQVSLKVSWLDTDTRATGYKLYWGTGSGTFENTADIGFPGAHSTTSPYVRVFTMPGLTKLCFAITAYNFGGESGKSDEFCNEIPAKRVLLKIWFSAPTTLKKKDPKGVPIKTD